MGSKIDTTIDADRVELIPWNPSDEMQFRRMREQRVACGWSEEEVPKWKDKVLQGSKLFYWIKLPNNAANVEKMVAQHLAQFNNESEPLDDTATNIGGISRLPTKKSFIPVGHVGLEVLAEHNVRFGLPPNTLWIKSLYISRALQSTGLGRCSMIHIERLAASSPFNNTTIALDTPDKEFQRSEVWAQIMYDARGLKRPNIPPCNEDWYLKQGYQILERDKEECEWPGNTMVTVDFLYMAKLIH